MVSRLLVWLFGSLVEDERSKTISHTKLWSNAGMCFATVIFLRAGWNTAPGEGLVYLLLAYGALVAGSRTASKLISCKYGNGSTNDVATSAFDAPPQTEHKTW